MKKLCIVVPYRNREHHLKEFLPHIEMVLELQAIDYHILIVEQSEKKAFNRGKLLNVGFDHDSRHDEKTNYFCFHDVDMLPIESDYTFCPVPTHLAAKAQQFGWKLPYNTYFGGVTLFDRESFEKVNGYANEYWGWGAEDDDMFNRCTYKKIQISRKNCTFRSLHHERIIDQIEYKKKLTFQKKLQK